MIDPEELGRIAVVIQQRGYVSIPKAAKLLGDRLGSKQGLHPQTVHKLVKLGLLRHIRVGHRKCITWNEIQRYNEEGNWDPNKHPEDDIE